MVNVASIQWQLSAVKEVHHSVQTNVGHSTQFDLQPETKERIWFDHVTDCSYCMTWNSFTIWMESLLSKVKPEHCVRLCIPVAPLCFASAAQAAVFVC